MLTYLVMGGLGTLYDELLPIFCSEDAQHGGLGMSSGQIGQILMVCGCALMLFQMFGYSRLTKALGPLRLLRLACWGHVMMMLLPPFGTTASHNDSSIGLRRLLTEGVDLAAIRKVCLCAGNKIEENSDNYFCTTGKIAHLEEWQTAVCPSPM